MSLLYQVVNERMIFPIGLIETENQPELANHARDWFHDASVDLEKALRSRTDLPSAYRSMLAKSLFLAGQDFPAVEPAVHQRLSVNSRYHRHMEL